MLQTDRLHSKILSAKRQGYLDLRLISRNAESVRHSITKRAVLFRLHKYACLCVSFIVPYQQVISRISRSALLTLEAPPPQRWATQQKRPRAAATRRSEAAAKPCHKCPIQTDLRCWKPGFDISGNWSQNELRNLCRAINGTAKVPSLQLNVFMCMCVCVSCNVAS